MQSYDGKTKNASFYSVDCLVILWELVINDENNYNFNLPCVKNNKWSKPSRTLTAIMSVISCSYSVIIMCVN